MPDGKRVFFQLVAGAALFLLLGGTASAQVPTLIQDINQDLPFWTGTFVEVPGYWIADDDGVSLWVSIPEMSETHGLNWIERVEITDGGAMPVIPEGFNYAEVLLEGTVSTTVDPFTDSGPQLIGSISITSFVVLTPPPPLPSPPPPPVDIPRAPAVCDSCHFVLIISGYNTPDYWNDVTQKYNYKKNLACPNHIVVLYDHAGSRDTGVIPNGTTSSGSINSGGVFPSTPQMVDSAFAYFKKKLKQHNCPTPRLQIHSTGHGGGYQTRDNQNGRTEHSGFGGGKLDVNGDEKDKIHENDLKFRSSWGGEYDLNGNGNKDIKIDYINNPNAPPQKIGRVRRDADGNGSFETLVGTDQNEDGHIDKDDGDWNAPDLNNSAGQDSVAFDEVIQLGNGNCLTDDKLKSLVKDIVDNTTLKKDSTRVELAQCFSGGFTRDLKDCAKETAMACGEGEVSLSKRGNDGFNAYEKPFIDALAAGRSWKNAHNAAKDSVMNQGWDETPEYKENAGPTTEPIPTLSEWAMIILSLALMGFAVARMRRRQTA